MKKFLDRYLFSKLGLQIVFSVVVILLFSFVGTSVRAYVTNHKSQDVYSQTFWGFRQITDGGSVAGTLDELDSVAEESGNAYGAPVVLAITLLSWLIGMVLYSFVTGAIVNAFEGRKDKIEGGKARYKFKNHGIVIGWDFQGVAAVMALFDIWGLKEVLVVSERPSEEIRSELENELDEKTLSRVFIYNGALGTEEAVEELYPAKARVIIVLGDRNGYDNDGGNLKIAATLRKKIGDVFKKAPLEEGAAPIQLFIDISGSYNLALAEMYPAEGYKVPKGLEIHIFNFCKATVRELYSSFAQFVEWNSGRRDGLYETPYMPLSFRRGAEATHAHIVVSGIGDMAKAIVTELAPLVSGGSAPGQITVFSADAEELARFSSAYPFGELQGVKVDFVAGDICDAANRERLAAIARDRSASVTIFVTGECADETFATANRLPDEVRFENVRLMVEQRILSKWAHKTYPLQLTGFRNVAFFGFLDRHFASIGKKIELANAVLAGETITGTRDRYFAESYTDGILENLASHGYRFVYNPGKAKERIASIEPEVAMAMARFEHARAVNFQLLHHVRSGTVDDDVFKTSSSIVLWEDVPQDVRAGYVQKMEGALAALAGLYNCGEYPYIVEKDDFRVILGAIPDELFPETASARRKLRDEFVVSAIKDSKTLKENGDEKSEQSIAFAIVPDKGLSRQMYRLSFLHSVPMILVLPQDEKSFLAGLDENDRLGMERWLRNADQVVVAEGLDAAVAEVKRLSTRLIDMRTD